MSKEDKIEWIVANENITFWNIIYFGVPLNFIILFCIFYFVVFPFWSNLIVSIIIYLFISSICSIITSLYIFIVSLDVYPQKVGFSDQYFFSKSRRGKIIKYKLSEIEDMKKKSNRTLQILKKDSWVKYEIRVDSNVITEIITKFNRYKQTV